jgi:hypothetical protein
VTALFTRLSGKIEQEPTQSDSLNSAQATDDCVEYRRMSSRHPKLQDLHRPRQQRETESDTDPRRFRPKSGREGEGGRVVGDKMLGYTWQRSVRPIDSDRTIMARTPKKPATREVARRKS